MKVLQDARYDMLSFGEDAAIEQLDYWLDSWLYRKALCPNCGIFDENDEVEGE